MKKHITLTILSLLTASMSVAQTTEQVLEQYKESENLSNWDLECATNNKTDYYLMLSKTPFELYLNSGLTLSEENCYQTKWSLKKSIEEFPIQTANIKHVELTHEVCNKSNTHCLPDTVYQTRVSMQIGIFLLTGYKQEEEIASTPKIKTPTKEPKLCHPMIGCW